MDCIDRFLQGDARKVLRTLPDESIDCVVTSPPYWSLRDYGVRGQLGLEPTVAEYVARLLSIFDEIKRVLKTTGTCFVNMGDTYGGSWQNYGARTNSQRRQNTRSFNRPGTVSESIPPYASARSKCLCQTSSRFAIAMTERGWILRNEIIWWKPACLPSSACDRFTVDFEKVFFFTKSPRYYFVQQFEPLRSGPHDIRRMLGGRRTHGGKWSSAPGSNARRIQRAFTGCSARGRNKRAVWRIPLQPYRGAHFATFPEALIETPILAGCPPGGIVLDPFMGSGTTAVVARRLGRHFVGIDLNPAYVRLAKQRLAALAGRPRWRTGSS